MQTQYIYIFMHNQLMHILQKEAQIQMQNTFT